MSQLEVQPESLAEVGALRPVCSENLHPRLERFLVRGPDQPAIERDRCLSTSVPPTVDTVDTGSLLGK